MTIIDDHKGICDDSQGVGGQLGTAMKFGIQMENKLESGGVWVGGSVTDLIRQSRESLANVPDDDLLKLNLAMLLLMSGEIDEASRLAREIFVEDKNSDVGLEGAQSAHEEVALAIIRLRPMIEARTSEYAGPEGARMVLEHYDKVILELQGR